jgi:hypothetical protein
MHSINLFSDVYIAKLRHWRIKATFGDGFSQLTLPGATGCLNLIAHLVGATSC